MTARQRRGGNAASYRDYYRTAKRSLIRKNLRNEAANQPVGCRGSLEDAEKPGIARENWGGPPHIIHKSRLCFSFIHYSRRFLDKTQGDLRNYHPRAQAAGEQRKVIREPQPGRAKDEGNCVAAPNCEH